MTLPVVSGQSLMDSVTLRLGGVSGAFNTDELLDFINDGIGATWSVLKALGEDYFVDDTQSTDSTSEEDYIATWTAGTREITLPGNTREIRLIECTTSGYKLIEFRQKRISDDDFQAIRREATDAGTNISSDSGIIYYAFVGARKLLFADFPPTTLTLVVFRVTSLNFLQVNDTLSEILYPFHRKIVDYAVHLAQLSIARESLSDRWLQQWQMGVKELAISAAPRASTNPEFIQDYQGA